MHGLDLTFGVAALFGIAALVMVALLVRLPAPGQDESAASTGGRRERPWKQFELVDGEGFEWPGPELVA